MNLIIGTSLQNFGEELAKKHEDIKVIETTIGKFSNGEIRILINESIRGKDIYILETGAPTKDQLNINDIIMETLILIDACVSAGAKSVTLFFLNYPYARQDKRIGRESIVAKRLSDCITGCRVNRIVTVDLHASQIQGFFDVTCDNLYALKTLCKYFEKNHFGNNKSLNDYFVLVSPDNGGAKRISAYSKRLGINNVIMHKERDYTKSSTIMKMTIVGNLEKIKGKTAIIIDDMIDTAGTMISAAKILVENGAKDVIIAATHGIFSGPALETLNECSKIREVIVTNTIPQEENQERCKKIKVADISDLIYDVMKCLMTGDSISELFN